MKTLKILAAAILAALLVAGTCSATTLADIFAEKERLKNTEPVLAGDVLGKQSTNDPQTGWTEYGTYQKRNSGEWSLDYAERIKTLLLEKYVSMGYDVVPRSALEFGEAYGMMDYIEQQAKLSARMQMEEEAIMLLELSDEEFQNWLSYKQELEMIDKKYDAEFQEVLAQQQAFRNERMLIDG